MTWYIQIQHSARVRIFHPNGKPKQLTSAQSLEIGRVPNNGMSPQGIVRESSSEVFHNVREPQCLEETSSPFKSKVLEDRRENIALPLRDFSAKRMFLKLSFEFSSS